MRRIVGATMLAMVVAVLFIGMQPAVKASFVEFRNLHYHDVDDLFSSLIVSGTVVLYDDFDLKSTANTITFANQRVDNLANYGRGWWPGNWDNRVRSLKVDGTVTLYENPNCAGRRITFTSSSLPYDYIGTEWNRNPQLSLSDNVWDCRTWHWYEDGIFGLAGPSLLDIFHGDSNNYVRWNSNGLVQSRANDGYGDPWKASNFDQGYERYESAISDLGPLGWNDRARSLRVEGRVILYENVGYGGASQSFTADTNLGQYGWACKASSLKLTPGSRVTLYENESYVNGGPSKSFVYPKYQPPDLKVSDKSFITLEAVVRDWYTDEWSGYLWYTSWTGAKFDVFAVDRTSGRTLMIEMYYVCAGGNLAWSLFGPLYEPDRELRHSGNGYNYLLHINRFPDRVQETVYPGDVARWRINVKSLIQDVCNYYKELDITKLNIAKISFTLESAWNGLLFNPAVRCNLNRLRLVYG